MMMAFCVISNDGNEDFELLVVGEATDRHDGSELSGPSTEPRAMVLHTDFVVIVL